MTTPQMPTHDHEQFDAICEPVGDFEPLPTVVSATSEAELEQTGDEEQTRLDELILAGLVAP